MDYFVEQSIHWLLISLYEAIWSTLNRNHILRSKSNDQKNNYKQSTYALRYSPIWKLWSPNTTVSTNVNDGEKTSSIPSNLLAIGRFPPVLYFYSEKLHFFCNEIFVSHITCSTTSTSVTDAFNINNSQDDIKSA